MFACVCVCVWNALFHRDVITQIQQVLGASAWHHDIATLANEASAVMGSGWKRPTVYLFENRVFPQTVGKILYIVHSEVCSYLVYTRISHVLHLLHLLHSIHVLYVRCVLHVLQVLHVSKVLNAFHVLDKPHASHVLHVLQVVLLVLHVCITGLHARTCYIYYMYHMHYKYYMYYRYYIIYIDHICACCWFFFMIFWGTFLSGQSLSMDVNGCQWISNV